MILFHTLPTPARRKKRRLREVATVFVGRCPKCRDLPDGEWFEGSEFEHWCGLTIVANLHHDKAGAEHWKFTRAYERPRRVRSAPREGSEAAVGKGKAHNPNPVGGKL